LNGFIYCISFIILYLYIFAPPFQFLPFGTDKLVFFVAIVYITYKKKWRNLHSIFKKEYALLLFILFFSFLRGFIGGEKTYAMYDFLLWGELITCAYFLYQLIDSKWGFQIDKVMIVCAIVASFISIFLILNPDLALNIKLYWLKSQEELIERFYYRGYGFSDGLFFAYPVVLGFCAGMIVMGIIKNKTVTICLFPLLIAIFANARSGLIPVFVSIILLLIFNFKYFVNNTLFSFFILSLLSGAMLAFINGNELLNTSFEWGLSFFDIMIEFFLKGEKEENLSALLGEMLVFPKNELEWLWGSGEFIFTDHKYTTDIGYLLRLNFGGILYSLLFYALLFYMLLRLSRINKYMTCFLFISLIYCHYKSDFFIVNPSSRFLFFVYTVSILNHNRFKPFGRLKTASDLKMS
jgi:hypothetical protein